MSSIIQDLQWRYAVKKFDNTKKLTESQLDLLEKAFQLTPTSYGLQPIKMVVVTDEKLKHQLLPAAFDQPQITTCSHLLVLCSQTNFGDDDIDSFIRLNINAMPEKQDYFLEYGRILKSRFAQKSPEEIQKWAADQAFIALGNLIDVCAVERIDACPMTGFDPEQFNRILELEREGLTAVALLPVGYRASDDKHQFDPKIRRPLNELIIEK